MTEIIPDTYQVQSLWPTESTKMGWGARPALLLVDVCIAYWKNGSPLDLSHNPEGNASPDSMRRLLTAARKGNVPVIWAQVRYNHPQMKDGGVQAKKTKTIVAWQDGDPRGLDALLPGLEPAAEDTVVLKRNPSAFCESNESLRFIIDTDAFLVGTNLATELHLLDVDTLVLGGVSTSGCIRATAMDAMAHGFRPMVSGDLRSLSVGC
jgi:nicotinamidase-related amidase